MSFYDSMHPALKAFYDFEGTRTNEERQAALEAARAEAEANPVAPYVHNGPRHGDRISVTLDAANGPRHKV